MPRSRPPYPAEFRQQMVELVRSGRSPDQLAREFEPSSQSIRDWVAQADRDEGRRGDGMTGAEREETLIPVAANGQDARFIDQVFPTADTSDFVGLVRCLTPEPGLFSAVAFELDGVDRIFTTLPVVPVVEVP